MGKHIKLFVEKIDSKSSIKVNNLLTDCVFTISKDDNNYGYQVLQEIDNQCTINSSILKNISSGGLYSYDELLLMSSDNIKQHI